MAAIALLLVGGIEGCAATTGSVSRGGSAQRGPAPVTTLGVAIDRKGEVARSTDTGISSRRSSQGIYVVRFPINVRNCIYGVSIADDNSTGVPPTGYITAGAASRRPTRIFVTTENRQGRFAGRPFHVTVTCPA